MKSTRNTLEYNKLFVGSSKYAIFIAILTQQARIRESDVTTRQAFFFYSNILTLTIPVLYVILCGFRCTSGILACGALLNPTFCRKVRSMCGLIARPYIVQMDVTTCQSPKLRFATLYKGIDRVTKTKLRFFPQKCKSLVGKGFYCRPPRGQLTKKHFSCSSSS